jgi:tetratricopeptide (TPR) repeat protein
LPSLASCADAKGLREKVAPPKDPIERARVAALQARFHDVHALSLVNQPERGLPLGEALLGDARAVGYMPLVGEVGFYVGNMQFQMGHRDQAVETLLNAGLDSMRGRDDEQAAWAFSYAGGIVGMEGPHPEEGLRWEAFAQAEYDRCYGFGAPELGAQRIAANSVFTLERLGRYEEARAAAEKAVRLRSFAIENAAQLTTRVPGDSVDEELLRLKDQSNLAQIYAEQGRAAEAVELVRPMLAYVEQHLGAHHFEMVGALENMGTMLTHAGRASEALPYFERALALAERRFGRDSPVYADTLVERARALAALGRNAAALDDDRRALTIFDKKLPPDYADRADVLEALGRDQLALDHAALARLPLEEGLTLLKNSHAPPLRRAAMEILLARALDARDRARARSLAEDSFDAYADAVKRMGDDFVARRDAVRLWLDAHR